MRLLPAGLLCLTLCLGVASCEGIDTDSSGSSGSSAPVWPGDVPEDPGPAKFTVNNSKAVPESYLKPAARQGTIELVEYESETTKPAYVYLPSSYNPGEKYDIFYLIHGWTGVAQEYLLGANGKGKTALVHIFDNLIERGDCRPFIAVTPTWDSKNQAALWGRSVDEVSVFHKEWLNNLVPAIEGKYSTFAPSTDLEGLEASRGHRIFGGFSLGCITTWWHFEYYFNLIKYYIPISGSSWHYGTNGGATYPDKTANFLANLVKDSEYKDDFHIYIGNGSLDVFYSQTHSQAMSMAKIPSVFNAETVTYNIKESGIHDFDSICEHLYNALPIILPAEE